MGNSISNKIKKHRKDKGLSQEALASLVGVTKSTISQWELGKSHPKSLNLLRLADIFQISIDQLESRQISLTNSECEKEFQAIPFYINVKAAGGDGSICINEEYKLIHVTDLPSNVKIKNLMCLCVEGDSMEPVLSENSILVIDKARQQIVDGKMYVFMQDGQIRVKILSYNKHQIRVSSYNSYYQDEFYRFDELDKLKILGQVVHYSTKID